MSFIVNLARTSLSLVLIVATSAVSADECVPSPWGADDQIGAANRVTPERTAAAAKLVKKGISHPLGIVIEPGMPAYPPRYTQLQVVQPNQQFNADLGVGWEASSNDDVLQMWLGTGPQLDGLGHMGEAGEFYNCNQGKDFSIITGLTKLDISGIPPMVGRGVMIDIAKQMGVDSLQAGQPITSDDIKAAMKSQGVTVGEGDVVLLHTGYTDATLKQNPSLWAGSIPGITNEASVFLAGLKPMAVGADTWGLGAVPPRAGDKIFYDHVVLLKQHGIYILETMNTGRLADEGVHEFMFVLGQARLKGAVQMIINPVAMW
ncbi:MAG: cyclase family protein [Pseudomonadota bacterium]|nr:cyclase family protein [Pseudomonadota bacterium]MED5356692.1 cyclase family protein [Pseudomonadota bacterium]MEE3096864.1 cyclase family protein [Pseudomonadota bacterium]